MLQSLKAKLRDSPIRKAYLMPHRLRFASGYFTGKVPQIMNWLFDSNECSNFTYELTDLNRRYLASLIAVATGGGPEAVPAIEGYFRELEDDAPLRQHLKEATLAGSERYVSDLEPRYCRRIGWYALARILKPRLIVETGVDKGLGTCVLAAAALRNAADGSPCQVLGTDINPEAGFLLSAPYDSVARVLYGDSIESLQKLDGPIDLFINDSDHSAEYEAREYGVINAKLSPRAFVIGDNAHTNDKLARFAAETGRQFLFFQEQPKDHWYPGAGMGLAFPSRI